MSEQSSITGVVIVTHGNHGAEMLNEAQSIVGELPSVRVVSVSMSDPPDVTNARLNVASCEVEAGQGILFLVDLYGATPANLCMAFMDGSREVEVLCGLNMAMLIKLATSERGEGPHDLADLLMNTGRRSIRLGREVTGRVAVDEIKDRT